MLKYKIKETLEAAGIQYPAQWLIKYCDFPETKAYKLINNKQTGITLKDLTRLCENLNCEPSALFYWSDTGRTRLPENHPLLTQLSKPTKTTNWFNLFKQLPPEKIIELQKNVIQDLEK